MILLGGVFGGGDRYHAVWSLWRLRAPASAAARRRSETALAATGPRSLLLALLLCADPRRVPAGVDAAHRARRRFAGRDRAVPAAHDRCSPPVCCTSACAVRALLAGGATVLPVAGTVAAAARVGCFYDTVFDPLPGEPGMPVAQYIAAQHWRRLPAGAGVPAGPDRGHARRGASDTPRCWAPSRSSRCCTSACVGSFEGRSSVACPPTVLNPISVGHLGATVFVVTLAGLRDLARRVAKVLRVLLIVVSLVRRGRFGIARADPRGPGARAAARLRRPAAPRPQHRRAARAPGADRRRRRAVRAADRLS